LPLKLIFFISDFNTFSISCMVFDCSKYFRIDVLIKLWFKYF
jgi:hypothetical protein